MTKLPEGRSTLTDEQMIGLTHRLVDTCIDCKGRIEELEAKLAKAVEHFKKLRRRQDCLETYDAVVDEVVETALAELTGGKDE